VNRPDTWLHVAVRRNSKRSSVWQSACAGFRGSGLPAGL
jgi:hypothetical protein